MTGDIGEMIARIVGKAIDDRVEAIAQKVDDLARARAAATAESLQPLHVILALTPRAANARLCRDADLRALGHRIGRRTLFKRDQVEFLYAERQRARCGTALEALEVRTAR